MYTRTHPRWPLPACPRWVSIMLAHNARRGAIGRVGGEGYPHSHRTIFTAGGRATAWAGQAAAAAAAAGRQNGSAGGGNGVFLAGRHPVPQGLATLTCMAYAQNHHLWSGLPVALQAATSWWVGQRLRWGRSAVGASGQSGSNQGGIRRSGSRGIREGDKSVPLGARASAALQRLDAERLDARNCGSSRFRH